MSIFKKSDESITEENEVQEGTGFKRQWLTIPIGLVVLFLIMKKKPEAAASEIQFIDVNGAEVPAQPTEVVPAEGVSVEEASAALPELVIGPRGEAETSLPSFISSSPTLPGTKTEEVVALPEVPISTQTLLSPEVAPVLSIPETTTIPVVEKKRVYDLFTGKIFQVAIVPDNALMLDRLKFAEQRGLVSNITVPGTLGSTSYKVISVLPDELDTLDDILSGKVAVPTTTVIPTATTTQATLPVSTIPTVVTPEPTPVPVQQVITPTPTPVLVTEKTFTLPVCSKLTVAQNFDVYTWNWYKPEIAANYKWQDATQCDGLSVIVFSTYPDPNWSGGCMYTYRQKFTNVTALTIKATMLSKWSFNGYMDIGIVQLYDETANMVIKEWVGNSGLAANSSKTTIINELVDGLNPGHVYAIRLKCKDGWAQQKSETRLRDVSIKATFAPGAPATTVVTTTYVPAAPVEETAVSTATPAITLPRTAVTIIEPCSGATNVQNMWSPVAEMLPMTYPSVTRGFKNWQEPTFCDGSLILEFNTYKIQPRAMLLGKVTYTYQGLKWKGVSALRVDGAVTVQYGAPDKESTHVQIYDETINKVVKDWGFASDYYTFKFKTYTIGQTISGLDPTHTYSIRLIGIDQIYNQYQVSKFDNLKITATYTS